MSRPEYLTFEMLIGCVRYGTQLTVTDEETDQEVFSGIYSFDIDLPSIVGDRISLAEVTLITVTKNKLTVKISFQNEEEDTGDEFNNV